MELTVYDIIKGPLRTSSKAVLLNKKLGKLMVYIHEKANKHQVKDAIQKLFEVKVKKVNTLSTGKKTRRVGQQLVSKSGKRKAIITLAEGYKLDFFDNQSVQDNSVAISDTSK